MAVVTCRVSAASPGEVGGSWTGAYVAEFGLRADYTH